MNCNRETTEMKVRLIVPLLGTHENKVITDLLRYTMPAVKIGDDYVRSVRKVWKDKGCPEDYKVVLGAMQYAHHKGKAPKNTIFLTPDPIPEESSPLELTQHEIARLNEFVRFLDSTDKTE